MSTQAENEHNEVDDVEIEETHPTTLDAQTGIQEEHSRD
jgi:hypothetical protein